LRAEDDRKALVQAVVSGLVEVIVSAHAPAPAEDKRLPFDEAAPGAVGLQTLLPALISLSNETGAPLADLWRAASYAPARLLGLDAGRIAPGAPADLVLFDPDTPYVLDADTLLSKSKNTPFDTRRLQGQVLLTMAGGRIVHRPQE
jgi:dihydroorotase